MFSFASVKVFLAKQAVKIAPKIGKAWLNSLLGKNKGEVINYRKENSESVICFVHGFNGKPGETFDEFPKLILNDAALDGWDVFSVGYATDMMPTIRLGLWAELPDLNKLSRFLITNVTALLDNYKRIAFVAHSMGGLVVQRAILDLDDNEQKRNRITYLLLYGTPSNGLHKAKFAHWLNPQVNDMAFGSAFIVKLREDWKNKFFGKMPFVFATVAGELDMFVPVESSQDPFASGHATTIGNHIDMVKPDSVNHTSYAILKKTIVNKAPFLQTFTSQALNNLLGDYNAIISALYNQIDVIGRTDFREYIFALEGYKNVEEAIAALEKSNRVQTDTDFIGILGGRYKRKYLSGKLEADKNKAIELYLKGYELSQSKYQLSKSKHDCPQVYYHAINLAFLYLYGEGEREKMTQYAIEALAATTICKDQDKWEIATIAEAYLYLNNLEESKMNYTAAIQKSADDERSVSSMYINAYNACVALDKNDWANEINKLFKRT
jgi:pimeloyl-ACP methyl ester carboxylesterase